MSKRNLTEFANINIEDNGELTNLNEVILEIQGFVDQFSTHAMSEYSLKLQGQKEAYLDVIEYLRKVAPSLD